MLRRTRRAAVCSTKPTAPSTALSHRSPDEYGKEVVISHWMLPQKAVEVLLSDNRATALAILAVSKAYGHRSLAQAVQKRRRVRGMMKPGSVQALRLGRVEPS
jgi:hypothetical protein